MENHGALLDTFPQGYQITDDERVDVLVALDSALRCAQSDKPKRLWWI